MLLRTLICITPLFLDLAVFVCTARAERLPIRTYTVADGLPHNNINCIVRDPRGFLWFCTSEGLSRFDGYSFVNYGTTDGLPDPFVTDLLITREGQYWIATHGGLVRFNPHGTPMFTVYVPATAEPRARSMTDVLQRRDGTVWVATWDGLLRVVPAGETYRLERVEMNLTDAPPELIETLLEDRHGTLWIGASTGLYRRWNDSHAVRVDRTAPNHVNDLLEDRQGQLWVGSRYQGFFSLSTTMGREPPRLTRSYRKSNGFIDWVFHLYEMSDGRLYAATNAGLIEVRSDQDAVAAPPRLYTKQHGFSYHEIARVAEDADGNLWLGTSEGAMKVARGGFSTFDERDKLVHGPNGLVESLTGGLYLSFGGYIAQFTGLSFTWVKPGGCKAGTGWGDQPFLLQSRSGEWWLGSGGGVCVYSPIKRLADLATARPMVVRTDREGVTGTMVYSLYEDSRGDVWIGTIGPRNGLTRWDHATRSIHDMSHTPGLPPLDDKWPLCFQEDRSGNLWVGFTAGGVARYSGGRFTLFTTAHGLPPGRINDLHVDRAGRLWVATSRGGLGRVDNPGASVPTFFNYTIESGLSSNVVARIAEDLMGRIYSGGGRGVDQIVPETGRIRRFTTADGLAPGEITAAFTERSGALWFGTRQGLSRMVPERDRQPLPPPIWISGLRVAGQPHKVSALGEAAVTLPDIAADRNQLQIDFVGVSFAPGETLRYQYKLQGGHDEWSVPSDQRTVHLAGVAPATYTFEVRAVNADRVVSPVPARVTFTILAPVWRRPWFLTAAALVLSAVVYRLYRYRVGRLVELERVRTRIASDLHDDIGAALSRIAILSEVARHEAGGDDGPVTARLSAIARASREVLDSMSDIVWAINPTRDQLRDLVQRMRRFASDIFTARGIALSFRAPQDERPLRVSADVRRHVFLIFKEAVNNIVRHSGATQADLELRVEGSWLTLTVGDNGRGFDPARAIDGQGLASMHDRAAMMSAQLEVTTRPGGGTILRLTAPLNPTIKEHSRRLHRSSSREARNTPRS